MSVSLARIRPLSAVLAALAVLVSTLAVAVLTMSTAHAIGARPAFQMPFPCGANMRLDTWDHAPSLDITTESSPSYGPAVVASAGGTVYQAGYHSGGGNMVIINHGGGWFTAYLHLRYAPLVARGQSVAKGQRIGYLGASGAANGVPHLHYEQLVDWDGNGYPRWGIDASQDGTSDNGEDVTVTFNGVAYGNSPSNANYGHTWRNVKSANACSSTPPPPPAPKKYWVDTFASAAVYGSPTSTTRSGTLYAGTNYVYCKKWGRNVQDSSGNYNHWWLKTDPDVGPANQYVSAYYLSRWGNDVAKDNAGVVIPNCA